MIQRILVVLGGVAAIACLQAGCSESSPGDPHRGTPRGAGQVAGSHKGPGLEITWRVGVGVTSEGGRAPVLEGITRAVLSDSDGRLEAVDDGRIQVAGQLDSSGKEHQVVVEGDLRSPNLEFALHAGVVAAGQVSSDADLHYLIRSAVGDLERALGDMLRLSRKEPRAWRAALASSEPDMQVLACRLLAARKEVAAIVDIVLLLRDPRPQVAEAAAGALVAIGSRDAVPLILESIERGNLRSEVRAIEAIGKLGGGDAIAYLEMVAEGHEIPEVRRVAGLALETARSNR